MRRLTFVPPSQTFDAFPAGTVQVRTLGVLAPAVCQLMGVGSLLHNNEITNLATNVQVQPPASCIATNTQAFCSFFVQTNPPTNNVNQNLTCNAIEGSPVLCGTGAAVNGFVISQGCFVNSGRLMVQYHPVQIFREWIDGVSGAEMNGKLSVLLVVSVMFMNLKNLM